MNCKLCASADTESAPFFVAEVEGHWVRCRSCGSDSNSLAYNAANYPKELAEIHRRNIGGKDAARGHVRSNCDWFGHHHQRGDDKTFLDVGCADGAALETMQELGWGVHGWDVVEPDYTGPHVTVSPFFHRWFFPRRYSAVLCREVIEHVDNPFLMLLELHGVCEPRGLVQIQTPKPTDYAHSCIYQRSHLFIPSPGQLRKMLNLAMLDVIDSREWDEIQPGQAYLCRARP